MNISEWNEQYDAEQWAALEMERGDERVSEEERAEYHGWLDVQEAISADLRAQDQAAVESGAEYATAHVGYVLPSPLGMSAFEEHMADEAAALADAFLEPGEVRVTAHNGFDFEKWQARKVKAEAEEQLRAATHTLSSAVEQVRVHIDDPRKREALRQAIRAWSSYDADYERLV